MEEDDQITDMINEYTEFKIMAIIDIIIIVIVGITMIYIQARK
jgi:hypothetical protein